MKKNMGGADRIIRLSVAIVILILYYLNVLTGTWAYVLLALSAVFVLTSFMSSCPLYSLVGLSTCKAKK
ncbi:MAG: DUF2892 domain-containing protein [Saonia sp.]